MHKFETKYIQLIRKILDNGETRVGRNGTTKSIFGETLNIDMSDGRLFPLMMGRRIYYKGVLGEMAAFLKGPKSVHDFKKEGCNYWDAWGDKHGHLNVDYGNIWSDFNGVNQLDDLRHKLKYSPNDRRMLISGWNPANLENLSLPCCHILYQWYVRDNTYLDMIWYQRSVDTMIGLPSDIVLAATWNIMLANETGYKPGRLTFNLGDTHIYKEHFEQAKRYTKVSVLTGYPEYKLNALRGMPIEKFIPEQLEITGYTPLTTMKLELKV